MSRHRVASDRVWQQLWLLPVLLCGACTDTVVQEPFNPPPDQNFLGFFTTVDKQTTCGNCHVTHQGQWIKTLHASAYDTLHQSSAAQSFCYTCHTVSDRGNSAAFPAGWNKVQDTVYYDVQCENCHGPGSTHVQAPDAPPSAGNPPLAHIAVPITATGGVDSTTLANSASCGSCHNQNSGPHVRAYEEWAVSGHARPVESPAGEANCVQCHEAKGILAAWGVTANYVERDQTGPENFLGQTCAVCHDPHGAAQDANGKPLEGQLRFPIDVANIDVNLCMKCHQRRSVPAQESSRGPHSPQGPMLLGDAGYHPAGFDPDLQAVASTHGTDANPSLCAGCHVQRLTSKDGKIVSAGHTFHAIPCLDANGLPNLANIDFECPHDVPSRSWAACTPSGCHVGGPAAVVAAFTSNEQLIDPLVKQIWDDKNRNNAVDPAPTDGGFLSNTTAIPLTEYATNDNKITPAEGALFNVRMLDVEVGVDGSHGVHNPFLARALLAANIEELRNFYPGLPPLSPPVQAIMKGPVGDMMRRQYHPPPSMLRTSAR